MATTMPPGAVAPAPATGAPAPEAVRRAAEEFEAVFLAQMLAGMFDGLGGTAGGTGGGAFEGMLRDEYARLIARSGGIGLADDIRREMLKLQEVT